MKISIVIPTKDRADKLNKVINSLELQSAKDFEVIIVNDGSNLNIKKSPLKIRIFSSKKRGASSARNIGIKNSQGEIVIFIGDDIYPNKNFIEEQRDFHAKNVSDNIAMLGCVKWIDRYANLPIYRFLDKGIQFDFASLKNNQQVDKFHFYTSNLSIKKSFLEEFDENMKSANYEDVELANRLTKKGMILIYNERALAFHDHYYDSRLLAARAFSAGKAFKYLKQKIYNLDQPYTFNINSRIKLIILSIIQPFLKGEKYKMSYYHFLYISNFLKGINA